MRLRGVCYDVGRVLGVDWRPIFDPHVVHRELEIIKTLFLHQLPLLGRFVRPRLIGQYVRDEGLPARELTETLAILDAAGVDGAFVQTFVSPIHP